MLISGERRGISACQELKEYNWYCSGTAKKILFFMNCYVVKRYSHHVEVTGRPFFMNSLFFQFLSQLVSCPVFLNQAVSWTVLTRQEELKDCHIDSLLISPRFDSLLCICKKRKKERNTTNNRFAIEFHDPCTCISNNFWTFLCEAHI